METKKVPSIPVKATEQDIAPTKDIPISPNLPTEKVDLANSRFSFSRLVRSLTPPPLPTIDAHLDKTVESDENIMADKRDLHRTIYQAFKDSIVIMCQRSPLMLFGAVSAAAFSAAIPVLAQKLSSFVPEMMQGVPAKPGIIDKAAL